MLLQDFLGRIQRTLPEGIPRRAATDLRLLRDIFQSKYGSILDFHPWSFLHLWSAVRLPADYTTGTISLTQGSSTVTGVGTVWSSSHVGRYLLAGGEIPLKVTAVGGATSLTIETPWGQSSQTGISYRLRTLVLFTGIPEVHSIYRIWWRSRYHPLDEKTLDYIDSIDPGRMSSGDPILYSTRGFSATNGMMFEVWPYQVGLVRVLSLRKPTFPGMAEDVLFPNTSVLELAVKMGVFEYAFSETGTKQWLDMAEILGVQYKASLEALMEEDRVASSWPQSTPTAEEPNPADLDPLTHDTMPW